MNMIFPGIPVHEAHIVIQRALVAGVYHQRWKPWPMQKGISSP
jgi:hypothetical protein